VGESGLPAPDGVVDFDGFVRGNTSTLLATARLLTGNRVDAEELVQETLVHLFPKWRLVEAAASPLGYVRRSLVNRFVSRGRASWRRETPVAELIDGVGAPDPADAVGDRSVVRDLLAELAPRPRAVLVLRYFHDLTEPQIAAELGCRAGTVRSDVSRSLAALRARLPRTEERPV